MKGATYSGMDATTATLDVGGAKIPCSDSAPTACLAPSCRLSPWLRSSGAFANRP
jgi:hypothetical protein